jgi:Flp pilus assembly protein TadB
VVSGHPTVGVDAMSADPFALVAATSAGLVVVWGPWARRIRESRRLEPPTALGTPGAPRLRGLRLAASVAAGLAPLVLLPPRLGVPGAAFCLVGSRWALRRSAAAPAEDPRSVAFGVDLVAAALAAGAPLPDALDAAAEGSPAQGAAFRRAAAALRLGADAAAAMGGEPALLRPARAIARAGAHGSAVSASLGRLAEQLRSEAAAAAAERARRAGVHVVAPLALCFLPAFVLVAVVPVVLGLARVDH